MAVAHFRLKDGHEYTFSSTYNDELDFIVDPGNIPEGDNPANHTRRRNRYIDSVATAIGGGVQWEQRTEDGGVDGKDDEGDHTGRSRTYVVDNTIAGYEDEDGSYVVINGQEVSSYILFDPATE